MLDNEPINATIIRRNNLSSKVAKVTANKDLSLYANALPIYSPVLAGVKTPAEKP